MGVILISQGLTPFLVPLKCVHMIKRDTLLQDIHQGKARKINGRLNEFHQLILHSGKASGYKTGFHGYGYT